MQKYITYKQIKRRILNTRKMNKPKFRIDQKVTITYKNNSVEGWIDEIHTIKYSEDNTKYFYKVRFHDKWIVNHKTGFGDIISTSIMRAEEFINKTRPNKNEE